MARCCLPTAWQSKIDFMTFSAEDASNVSAVTPTDPDWERQWNMRSIGIDHAWSLIQSRPTAADEGEAADGRLGRFSTVGHDDSEIIIAVLDTGEQCGSCLHIHRCFSNLPHPIIFKNNGEWNYAITKAKP
jgi:hypothetical protein